MKRHTTDTFADRLKKAMLDAGYSRDGQPDILHLAYETRLPVASLHGYVYQGTMPKDDTMRTLARVLAVTPGWLRYGDTV